MPSKPPHKKQDLKLPHELEPLAKDVTPGLAPTKEKKSPGVTRRKKGFEVLFISVVIGTIISLVIATAMMYFKININVMLPVLAPIWVGSISLIFMAWRGSS